MKAIILKAKTDKDYIRLAEYLLNMPADIDVDLIGTCENCKFSELDEYYKVLKCHNIGNYYDDKNTVVASHFCRYWENEVKTFKDPDKEDI